ncbi:hypothetical protein Vretimale_16156, partial [Volvox reticuliferus]
GPSSSRPLFVCQGDFEKAFDQVPRHLLWKQLQERGIHGHMLEALQSCYNKVFFRIRVNGESSDPFESKQGREGILGGYIRGICRSVSQRQVGITSRACVGGKSQWWMVSMFLQCFMQMTLISLPTTIIDLCVFSPPWVNGALLLV